MSGRTADRDLLYCHQCQDEWYKTDAGLKCPTCQSEIVEIIQPDTDPRADYTPHHDDPHHHHHHHHHHPLHEHNPWGGDAPDPDDGDISHVEWTGPGGARFSRTTMRSTTPGGARMQPGMPPGMPPGMADAFGPMFGSMMGGFTPPGSGPSPGNEGIGNATTARNTPMGPNPRIGTAYTFSMNGPGHVRMTRSGGNVGLEDLNGIMGNIFNMFAPPGATGRARGSEGQPGGGQQGQPAFNPIVRMLMELVPPTTGAVGDVAYTQEAYDRIMTMLRDQGEVAGNAPGPASAAAINALPKIKISKEQLDEEGKADCSICMESVNLGTEVTQLPCSHWFHGECAQSWLKEHDTCPQCRRGIMPEEGDDNAPRSTGQTPRNWRPNRQDVDAVARGARGGNQSRGNDRGPSNQQSQSRQPPRAPNSPTISTSSRSSGRSLSGVTGFISGIGRRLGGGGNDGGGGSGGSSSRH